MRAAIQDLDHLAGLTSPTALAIHANRSSLNSTFCLSCNSPIRGSPSAAAVLPPGHAELSPQRPRGPPPLAEHQVCKKAF